MTSREQARLKFIQAQCWSDAEIAALPADASFRRYFRLTRGNGETALIMDAPPDKEATAPFIKIDTHLRALGLRAPEIRAKDVAQGFLLLEDFGNDTFTRLLAAGHDERALYELAIDVLIHLHRNPSSAALDLQSYDEDRLIEAASLLLEWYVPEATGQPISNDQAAEFRQAWKDVFSSLAPLPPTLMLRDYHVDNLMVIANQQGIASCGVLDFQDAMLGSPAYDVVSLLEDARRDISDDLTQRILNRYKAALLPAPGFFDWYAVLGAQRHCRVMGVFVRLSNRDGKHGYRVHLPRLGRLLARQLAQPALAPLAAWFNRYLPLDKATLPS